MGLGFGDSLRFRVRVLGFRGLGWVSRGFRV